MTARQSAEQGTELLRCGSIAPVLRFPRTFAVPTTAAVRRTPLALR